MSTARNKISMALGACVMLALTACSGLKPCKSPDLNLPDRIASGANDSLSLADMEWWEIYTDTCLTSIIRETLDNNRDFGAAAARVEELSRLYGASTADLFPTIGFNAYGNQETYDYSRSDKVVDPEYGLKATLSWEIDLFGALRQARKGAGARYRASIEDYRALQTALIASCASGYFSLMALDNELAIVRRTLVTREENLRMARLRYEGGLTPETTYRQAEVEYATTAAMIPNLERRITEAQNALCVLMGRFPGEAVRRSMMPMDGLDYSDIPVGAPSVLLERRPDIRSASQNLAASMAAVGVAYANRFPSLRINLHGGVENDEMPHFFKSPFTYVAGQLAGPLFDFGNRRRKYQAAIAAYDRTRLQYEQTVIRAFTEVNNAVISYRKMRETTALRRTLREAAGKYVELAHVQYRAGAINYIDVLDAQRRYFDAQIGVANAVRDEYICLITLYKALGGGWNYTENK